MKKLKLIAKTLIGTEFLHSRKECYFAPAGSAKRMADEMNKIGYKLNDGEKWHVYDYDWSMENYVCWQLYYYRGDLNAKRLC